MHAYDSGVRSLRVFIRRNIRFIFLSIAFVALAVSAATSFHEHVSSQTKNAAGGASCCEIIFAERARRGNDGELSYDLIGMHPDGAGDRFYERFTSTSGIDEQHPALNPLGNGKVVYRRSIYQTSGTSPGDIYLTNVNQINVHQQLTDDPADDYSPAWSPNGNTIVFVSDRNGNPDLYLLNLNTSTLTQLTNDPAADIAPTFSPDGNSVVFSSYRNASPADNFANGEIYRINLTTQVEIRITFNDVNDTEPAWSPDGQTIAFSRSLTVGDRSENLEIFTLPSTAINSVGGTRLTFSPPDKVSRMPAWSPDNLYLTFSSDRDDLDTFSSTERHFFIYKMKANGTFPVRLTLNDNRGVASSEDTLQAFDPSWNVVTALWEGHKIMGSVKENGAPLAGVKVTMFFPQDPTFYRPKATTITDANGFYLFDEVAQGESYRIIPAKSGYEFDAREQLIAVLNSDTVLNDFNATNRVPTSLPIGSSQIVFTSRDRFASPRLEDKEIYIMNSDGSQQTRLTYSDTEDMQPAISPNGQKIAFVSARHGNYEIYVMNSDGSNVVRLTESLAINENPSWSPDGTRIVYSEAADVESTFLTAIYVINADGTNRQQLTIDQPPVSYNNRSPIFSPDGSKIAFAARPLDIFNPSADLEVYTINASGPEGAGNPRVQITNNNEGEVNLAWSPDGGRIAFDKQPPLFPQLAPSDIFSDSVTGSPGALVQLTSDAPNSSNRDPSYSPDGSQIAFFSTAPGNSGNHIRTMNAADGSDNTLITMPGDNFEPSWGRLPLQQFFIRGRVTDAGNAPQSGITITLSGASSAITATAADGTFQFNSLVQNGDYTVTPSFGQYTFSPANLTVNDLSGNTFLPDFTSTSPAIVRGRITDICGDTVGGAEVRAVPSNSAVLTNGDGLFELPVPRGGSYTVTPQLAGWIFAPVSRTVNNVMADLTVDDFLATPPTIDYVWTGIGAGTGPNFDASWANANNWTVNTQPTNGRFPRCVDYATIDTTTTVHLAGPRTVKRFTYSAGEVYGGTLSVTERMDWYGASAANQSALIYNANLTIPTGSELHLQGSEHKALHGGVLTNQGTIVWTGDYISLDSTALNSVCRIDNFGTLRLESTIDLQLFLNGAPDCTFNNKPGAAIAKPAVANYAPNTVFQQSSGFSNAKLNNEGTIATSAGRLIILGSAEFKSGTRFEGGGVTLLNGGLTTKKVSGQVTIANGATLETGLGGLDGYTYGGVTVEGTAAGSINTEGSGTFLVGSGTYFDGTINLSGRTDIEVTTSTSNPSVSLESPNNGLDTINNTGTVNWRGNTLYIGSSIFNNHGTFNILSDNVLQSQGSVVGVGSVFNNFSDGTVRKSNTSGVTDFMNYPFLSRFDNNGLVDIQTGKIVIHNGLSSGKFRTAANTEIEIQQNEMFTFLGSNLESGGVFRNNGGTMSGSFRGTLQMLSGNVAGDMTALSPTPTLPGGTFDWRGGLIGNATFSPTPTTFMIQTDAAMLIDASDQATFSGSFGNTVVTNNGVVQWTGQENTSIGVGDGGNNTGLIFHNNGTVFLQSDGTLFRHGDSSIFTFNNNSSGVFKKSGGNGSTKLDIFSHDFNNFGTIEIISGVLESGGVEFEFKNNSRIKSGGGRFSLNHVGGTSDAVGTVTLEGSGDPDNFVLELGGESNGVTLDGNGLTFAPSNNGGFLWTGGTIRGNVVLGSGLRTKIRSGGVVGNVTLDGSLSNGGTFAWENGMDWHVGSSGSSTFTNLAGGTFDHQTAGTINNQSGFEFNFVNAGTLNIGGSTRVFNVSGSGVNAINFSNQATGVVNMDIAGAADFDRLTAPAVMNLGGRLNVNLTGDFVPTAGDEFKIFEGQMTGTARQGSFSQVSVPTVSGKSLRLDYNADDLTLQTAAVFIWSGAVDGNWNNPANWQGGQVPPADGLVEIPETGVVNSPDLGSMSVTVANLVVSGWQNVNVGDGETLTVDGVLDLDGGDIDTTGNTSLQRSQNVGGATGGLLVIGANGAVNRTGGKVNGKMSKIFGSPSSFTFPVGTASGYAPVDVNVTTGNGQMTVEAKQGVHPNASVSNAISRYWTLQGVGITSNLTFHYLESDVAGMESLYQILKVSGGSSFFYPHGPPQVIVDAANNTGSISGVSSYSDWTLSANLGPTAATAAISGRLINASGNGIAKAVVTISGGNLAVARQIKTSSLGYYRFDDLTVGETYVVTVGTKRNTFQTPSRLISLLDDAVDVDFTAEQ